MVLSTYFRYCPVSDQRTRRYHAPVASIPGIALGDSTLINGKGRFPGGPKADLAVVNVQKGKRYRLRVVSVSCESFFDFSIDGHDLQVIEVEGTAVLPVNVNSVRIFSGVYNDNGLLESPDDSLKSSTLLCRPECEPTRWKLLDPLRTEHWEPQHFHDLGGRNQHRNIKVQGCTQLRSQDHTTNTEESA